VSDEDARNAAALARLVARYGTKRLVLVPTQLNALLDDEKNGLPMLRALEIVLTSGEPLSMPLAARFRSLCPSVGLVNGWGTSECAGLVCMHTVGPTDSMIVVGHPRFGTNLWVLDHSLQLVPEGTVGEIYISGPQIATGYWRRPAMTAERFVPSPFGLPGDRMYRTGDFGTYSTDRGLEVVGRNDQLVKVRGKRVNLGDIERALEESPGVERAAVVMNGESENALIMAYVKGSTLQDPDGAAIRASLAERLPKHMIPLRVTVLRDWPMLRNGKINRTELRTPSLHAQSSPGLSTTEAVLAQLATQLLDGLDVPIASNLFDLGLDSIRTMRFVAVAAQRGLSLTMEDIFTYPTIQQLAAAIDRDHSGHSLSM